MDRHNSEGQWKFFPPCSKLCSEVRDNCKKTAKFTTAGERGKKTPALWCNWRQNAPQNKCPNTGTINVNLTLVWTPSAKILKMQFQAQKEASQIQEPAKHKGSEILALRGQEEKN